MKPAKIESAFVGVPCYGVARVVKFVAVLRFLYFITMIWGVYVVSNCERRPNLSNVQISPYPGELQVRSRLERMTRPECARGDRFSLHGLSPRFSFTSNKWCLEIP